MSKATTPARRQFNSPPSVGATGVDTINSYIDPQKLPPQNPIFKLTITMLDIKIIA
jgi:hypothetical protein